MEAQWPARAPQLRQTRPYRLHRTGTVALQGSWGYTHGGLKGQGKWLLLKDTAPRQLAKWQSLRCRYTITEHQLGALSVPDSGYEVAGGGVMRHGMELRYQVVTPRRSSAAQLCCLTRLAPSSRFAPHSGNGAHPCRRACSCRKNCWRAPRLKPRATLLRVGTPCGPVHSWAEIGEGLRVDLRRYGLGYPPAYLAGAARRKRACIRPRVCGAALKSTNVAVGCWSTLALSLNAAVRMGLVQTRSVGHLRGNTAKLVRFDAIKRQLGS